MIRIAKAGLSPVGGDMVDKEISLFFVNDAKVADLSPEVVSVGTNSVDAVIFGGNDNCQHLALTTG